MIKSIVAICLLTVCQALSVDNAFGSPVAIIECTARSEYDTMEWGETLKREDFLHESQYTRYRITIQRIAMSSNKKYFGKIEVESSVRLDVYDLEIVQLPTKGDPLIGLYFHAADYRNADRGPVTVVEWQPWNNNKFIVYFAGRSGLQLGTCVSK